MLKYIHARMPGRELVHLVPTANLKLDARFADSEEYVVGWARTLCGKKNQAWIIGSGVGVPCERCAAKR